MRTQATLVGEAITKANDVAKRLENAHYVDGSHWDSARTSADRTSSRLTDELPGSTKR